MENVTMDIKSMVSEIDLQIMKLTSARTALMSVDPASTGQGPSEGRGPSRPKKVVEVTLTKAERWGVSEAGRRRLSESMKRRWAERKKTGAPDPNAPKPVGRPPKGVVVSQSDKLKMLQKAKTHQEVVAVVKQAK